MNRWRIVLPALLSCALAGAGPALADAPRTITLDPAAQQAAPAWRLDAAGGGLALRFDLPALSVADVESGGTAFAEFGIEGGELVGVPGQAALPVAAQLVAVPEGMTVRVADVRMTTRTLDGAWLPLPAQAVREAVDAFDYDRAWYADKAAAPDAPRVELGEPARLHGVRVVPVTVHPVAWDRGSGRVTAASSMEIALEYAPSAAAPRSAPADRPLPESFATLLEQTVLGFDKSNVATVPLGTWVCIMPSDLAVEAEMQPLLEWRARQGYNVVTATTAETGTTNTAIKTWLTNLYATEKTPLEMVCLVGDADGAVTVPSWRESLSGYSGEGDHPYTQLDGPDILADVHLGRLSATSTSELGIIVDKIVAYESDPWLTDDTGWYLRAGLTGDPSSSGYSTIWVNQWVKEELQGLNYAQIDTIWGGNFVTQMMATVNAGESLFTYRGYWNMSGLNTGYIASMSNGAKLPYAVILTCDTGSFWSDQTCRSEAFLRAPGGGGVASIGTATIGTHTRYNNCMFLGAVDNVLNSGDNRFGPSLTRGKLNMYANYMANEPDKVTIWSTWNNLMGDPATSMWTAVPRALTVTAPSALDGTATALPVTVMADGQPVEGAVVGAYRKNVYSAVAATGADGRVLLPLDNLADGVLYVTVTGRNLQPWQGQVNFGAVALSLNPADVTIDDDATGASFGDGDGIAEPGETVEIAVRLTNGGTGAAAAASAILASPLAGAAVVQDAASYGAVAPGDTVTADLAFVVSLAADLPGGIEIPLEFTASEGAETFTGLVPLAVSGAALSFLSADAGGGIDPGQTGALNVTLANLGDQDLAGATATLSSNDLWISVIDGNGSWGAITAGGASAASDGFTVAAAADCIPGHLSVLSLDLTYAGGGTARVDVPVTFGTATTTDPAGPDAHGYYAFDNTDTSWPQAPSYEWIEIDPAIGGGGTSLGLNDFAIYSDDTKTIDLPFAFRYYGQEFAKISICSNGWFAFGTTYQRHYRNWTLPAPGVPDNMVCVYWDEVYMAAGDGGVFTWYDAANHRFVIEWRRMRNEIGGAIETFQAVLLDPAYEAGDTGDGIIVMQYETVNQVDSLNGYATVGIQNATRDDCMLYTYWNAYAPGAAQLAAGRAIRFATVQAQAQGWLEGQVTAAGSGDPLPGAVVSLVGAGRSLAANAAGSYGGSAPVGTWDVAVSHPGFAPDTTYGVAIAEGAATVVDFALLDTSGPTFSSTLVPATGNDAVGPYAVSTVVSDPSGVAAVACWYTSSTTGGPFELPVTYNAATGLCEASIPGQALGSRVQFWFQAVDTGDHASYEPAAGPFGPYAFAVIDAQPIAFSDMETDDGWTSGAPDDDASTGQWVRIDPNLVPDSDSSMIAQPEDDHTEVGTMCWFTGDDAVGAVQGSADVDGGKTTLLSPIYDVSGTTGLELRYWRWYTNNTGNAPDADTWLVQASFDGGAWIDLENTMASEQAWVERVFALEDLAPGLGTQLQLRFVAEDIGSGSVVEAGVDDVSLTGYVLPAEAEAPTVSLLTPAVDEVVPLDTMYDVTWNHADDIGVVEARIFLDMGNEGSWTEMARGPFDQVWTWHTPVPVGLPLGAGDKANTAMRLRVDVLDAAGNAATAESGVFYLASPSSVPGAGPTALNLAQNRPNPFNPSTTIAFSLPERGQVTLRVYDVEGRLVRTLVNGALPAGGHEATWRGDDDDGRRAASGLYFYRLQTPSGDLVRKMTLVK